MFRIHTYKIPDPEQLSVNLTTKRRILGPIEIEVGTRFAVANSLTLEPLILLNTRYTFYNLIEDGILIDRIYK